MSEKTSDAYRKFQPVQTFEEAQRLLKESVKTSASTLVWAKNKEISFNTHLTHYSESGQQIYAWAPKDFEPVNFGSALRKLGEPACYFSISLPHANIFFKATFIGQDGHGLKYEAPTQIFKVQRREGLRFPTHEGYSIKVEFDMPSPSGERISRKVLDISGGGLSFFWDGEKAPPFGPTQLLNGLRVILANRVVDCAAEVRHLKPLLPNATRPEPGWRVGVQFRDIKAPDEQFITAYVWEENRKYLMRFV